MVGRYRRDIRTNTVNQVIKRSGEGRKRAANRSTRCLPFFYWPGEPPTGLIRDQEALRIRECGGIADKSLSEKLNYGTLCRKEVEFDGPLASSRRSRGRLWIFGNLITVCSPYTRLVLDF